MEKKEKRYYYEYDISKCNWLIKQGMRDRITGMGTGVKGDTFVCFRTDGLFWAIYDTYKNNK